ncbi:extracellular solute-binding protein [Halospeciosus flavus]|uniref:Substrate-binding domain-containing protein n=1 Tax=Halospeciosus flavus TaxID=3032283 RepID=A0ABD5Z842_9EURY|nr:extracellular solute-binding protein [Halospeciosus flavus]
MSEQRSRRAFLGSVGTAAALGLAGCTGTGGNSGDGSGEGTTTDSVPGDGNTMIFHAGSLAPPFSAAEPKFEEKTGIQVTREAKGSVASTKKITQQGRKADVLGVSDFRLIRNRVLPEYGDWYSIFATNAMSIQYREDSPGADDISKDNWWEVLSRDDVTIGHSDPAVDPGGYRAVMSQQLGAIEFDGKKLYDDATYQKLRENSVVPTGTETNLEGQLKSGKLDYVIYYQSISASADMPWIDLQPEVDLSKATSEYAKHYAKAKVETDSGTFTGAPIAYGLTVPSVAESPSLGARWVEYFATEPGMQVLKDKGLQPVSPIVVPESGKDAVPERVMKHAKAQQKLGPMEL